MIHHAQIFNFSGYPLMLKLTFGTASMSSRPQRPHRPQGPQRHSLTGTAKKKFTSDTDTFNGILLLPDQK
jgi:hypothetical protein